MTSSSCTRAASPLPVAAQSPRAPDSGRKPYPAGPNPYKAAPIRAVASRTRDVLEAVAAVAEHHGRAVDEAAVDDLAVALEFGVPPSCATLARALGQELSRGDYLALIRARATTPASAAALGADALSSRIGPAKAQAVLAAHRRAANGTDDGDGADRAQGAAWPRSP